MIKIKNLILIAFILTGFIAIQAESARTDDLWQQRFGTYIESSFSSGMNILINGANKYLNFGTLSGISGYGFRDNSGSIEFKNSGGAWTGFSSFATSGALTAYAPINSPTFTGTVTLPVGLTGPVRTDAGIVSVVQEGDQFTRVAQALGSVIKFNTVGPMTLNSGVNMVDNTAIVMAVYIDRPTTITGVKWFQSVAGDYTADQTNHVALYSYSGGTLTQVASSTNDGNIWKATANTIGSKAFATPYSATPGVYFVAAVYNASSAVTVPQIVGSVTVSNSAFYSLDLTNSAKISSTLATTNSLPATISASSLSASSFTRWFGLY